MHTKENSSRTVIDESEGGNPFFSPLMPFHILRDAF
jgi:hypothetical protein